MKCIDIDGMNIKKLMDIISSIPKEEWEEWIIDGSDPSGFYHPMLVKKSK